MARLNRPAVPAVLLLLVGIVFVALRVSAAGSGQVGSFVYAGSEFARPPLPGVPVQSGPGYDGQFAYRLAVDPAELSTTADGITLDTPLRLERIAYPALAWVFSAGQRGAVPVALVVVNLLALAGLGLLGGLLARRAGRHAAWGLLLAGYWGYLFSLGRDLHEIVTGVFVLGGLLAYRAHRAPVAALLLSVAVLARETALLVVVAIAAVRFYDIVRRRTSPGRADAVWAAPIVVFIAWQAVCYAAIGQVPALAAGPAQVGPPVVALLGAVGRALGELAGGNHRSAAALLLIQLVALAVVVGAAAGRVRHRSAPREERLAWILALVLTLCLSRHFWTGPADLRALSDVYLLSAVLLIGAPAKADAAEPVPAASSGLATAVQVRPLPAVAAVSAAVTFAVTFVARVVQL